MKCYHPAQALYLFPLSLSLHLFLQLQIHFGLQICIYLQLKVTRLKFNYSIKYQSLFLRYLKTVCQMMRTCATKFYDVSVKLDQRKTEGRRRRHGHLTVSLRPAYTAGIVSMPSCHSTYGWVIFLVERCGDLIFRPQYSGWLFEGEGASQSVLIHIDALID